jgi:hypothetical protein
VHELERLRQNGVGIRIVLSQGHDAGLGFVGGRGISLNLVQLKEEDDLPHNLREARFCVIALGDGEQRPLLGVNSISSIEIFIFSDVDFHLINVAVDELRGYAAVFAPVNKLNKYITYVFKLASLTKDLPLYSQEGNLLAKAMDEVVRMVLVHIAQTLHQARRNLVVCNK